MQQKKRHWTEGMLQSNKKGGGEINEGGEALEEVYQGIAEILK